MFLCEEAEESLEHLFVQSELVEETGYESRRTSKDELFVLIYGMSRDREGAQNFKMANSE